MRVSVMIRRHVLAELLLTVQIALFLLLPSCSLAQSIQVKAVPSKLTARPGDRISMTLYIRNLGSHEIVVKGFNLKIRSIHLYLIPMSFPFGRYYVPLDEPIKVEPGEEKAIREIIEVPYINYQGDFDVEITVISNGGEAKTHLEITLVLTLLSASIIVSYLIVAGLLLLGLYFVIKRMKSERWRRKISSIDRMLKRGDELIDALRSLEERRSQGKVDHREYLDLKARYEDDLRSIHLELRKAIPDLEIDIRRISLEVNNLRNELEELRRKLASEMSDKETRDKLEHVESMIKSREKILEDLIERKRRIADYLDLDSTIPYR